MVTCDLNRNERLSSYTDRLHKTKVPNEQEKNKKLTWIQETQLFAVVNQVFEAKVVHR